MIDLSTHTINNKYNFSRATEDSIKKYLKGCFSFITRDSRDVNDNLASLL